MRVLIVEDDPLLGEALAAGLKQRGFAPDWVQDGREAQTAMRVRRQRDPVQPTGHGGGCRG